MARAHAEITVARPIEEVFAVLTDVEHTRTWFPVDVEEHWTSPPPHGVGSTRHAVIHAFGQRTENDATVIEYDPPRRGAMVVESAGVRTTVAMEFAPVKGGTRVSVGLATDASGVMRLAVLPFMAWYVGKWRRGLSNLKAKMEAGELRP
jgi:uncharacterized protein YndB with AHSA1/START domain